MKKNESFLRSVEDVLDLAMMLETQALDLYLRFAEKSTNTQTKDALFTIADEEKAHLNSLGSLLEQKIQTVRTNVKPMRLASLSHKRLYGSKKPTVAPTPYTIMKSCLVY